MAQLRLGGRRIRLRSMWRRAVIITVAVALAPMVFVFISNLVDARVGDNMQRRTERATLRVADNLGTDDLDSVIDSAAWSTRTRVRLIAPDGTVVSESDHESRTGLVHALGSLFFEADNAPTLADFDNSRDPLMQRWEVLIAQREGQAKDCVDADEGKLLVCTHARLLPDGRIAYAQESSRRAIRALYDVRYQMAKLTVFQVGFALLLGLWFGWRIARPLQELREQVAQRTAPPLSTEAILVDRDDEIGDVGVAFNELLTALRARNADYQAFVEDMAHEMKNPVAAIRVASESLNGPIDQRRAERLSRILKDSSQRLDACVTRFLELARAEAGLTGQERDEVDLGALIVGIVDVMEQDDRFTHICFVRALPEAPARIHGVPTQLETAIRNLVENAASFVQDDGEVRVQLRTTRRGFAIDVEDTGPGIAPEDLDRVFDRFFTRRADGVGTGLGLAMARAVVEAHNGKICARSQPGQGATFTIELPRA